MFFSRFIVDFPAAPQDHDISLWDLSTHFSFYRAFLLHVLLNLGVRLAVWSGSGSRTLEGMNQNRWLTGNYTQAVCTLLIIGELLKAVFVTAQQAYTVPIPMQNLHTHDRPSSPVEAPCEPGQDTPDLCSHNSHHLILVLLA